MKKNEPSEWQRCSDELARHFRLCPAMGVLLVYATGIAIPVMQASGCAFIALTILGLLSCFIWLRRKWYFAIILFAMGVVLGDLHKKAPWQTYLQLLPRADCSARIQARIGEFKGNKGKNWTADIHIRSVRFCDTWTKCSGKALAVIPVDCQLQYGAIVEMNGAFVRFDNGGYAAYNEIFGIRRLFYVQDAEVISPPGYIRRLWGKRQGLREEIAGRLTEGMESPDCIAMYKAMTMGLRGELTPEVNEVFEKSATVHLFSISGLHVGLLCLCIMWIARCLGVPLRFRIICVPLLLTGYVLLSGGAPSAMRAYWMIIVLTLADLRFRSRSTENALAAASLLLLILNPLLMLHIGFIFSFTLVFVLLRGMNLCQYYVNIVCERRRWYPQSSYSRKKWGLITFCHGTAAGSMLAWFGCGGLTMRMNGMLSFGSVIINSVLPPVGTLLVAGSIPKLLFAYCWRQMSIWIGKCLEGLLGVLLFMSRLGAREGMYVHGAMPHVWMVLCYYGLLVMALSRLHPLCRISAFLCMLALPVFFVTGTQSAGVIMTMGNDGGPASVAVIHPGGEAVIPQPGGRDSARIMIEQLAERGITSNIHIFMPSSDSLQGTKLILNKCKVKSIAVSKNAVKGRSAVNVLRNCRSSGIHVSNDLRAGQYSMGLQDGNWNLLSDKQEWVLTIIPPSLGENTIIAGKQTVTMTPSLKPQVKVFP